jgi:AcrR family transcriptional regulator
MTGLREKQKKQRRFQIEQAAIKLFDKKGFDLTTVDEIAAKALVSPATIYNYFGAKGEVLLAIVAHGEEGTRERLNEFSELAESQAPGDLVAQIICSNMQDTLKHVSRSLWGNVVAYIATTNDPEVGPRYLSTISDDLAKAIKLTLERFIELGKIHSIDAQQFAFVLTRLERNHFLGYIYMKTMVLDDLLAGVTADVKLVMDTITV